MNYIFYFFIIHSHLENIIKSRKERRDFMKRKVFVGVLILVIGVGSLIAYGESNRIANVVPGRGITRFTTEDREAWFKEMFQFRKEELKEAIEKGFITEEEAKAWENHFNYMEKFHEENDFMPFGCGGFGLGRGKGMGLMRGRGYKGHMFRGYY